MSKLTAKQEKATRRNWNKKMLAGAAYSLKSMISAEHLKMGLTKEEITQIDYASDKLLAILENWKRTLPDEKG